MEPEGIPASWRTVRKADISTERLTLEERHVSLNLVYSHWANRGIYRKIADARAYDDLLDDRAGHHRIDPGRRHYGGRGRLYTSHPTTGASDSHEGNFREYVDRAGFTG